MVFGNRLKSELFLVFATLLWGGTFVILKTGLIYCSPVLFVGIRFLLAFLIFLPVIIMKRDSISAGTIKAGVILGATMFAGYGFLTAGLVVTSSSRSGLISYGYALFVPFLQVLILRKNVKLLNLLTLVMALVGMYIFTSSDLPGSGGWNKGDTLTFLAAICYALNIVYLDKYTRLYRPEVLTGLQFGVMAILSGLYVLLFEAPSLEITGSFLFSLFYLVVFGSVAAIFIMNRYQKGTTPVRAVVIYALEPVLAVISGWFFLGEKISARAILGGSIIIGGVLLSEILGVYLAKKRNV